MRRDNLARVIDVFARALIAAELRAELRLVPRNPPRRRKAAIRPPPPLLRLLPPLPLVRRPPGFESRAAWLAWCERDRASERFENAVDTMIGRTP